MAHTPFTVEVMTPEGSVFKDEVEMVSTRTVSGSIGLLAGHQPLLGQLVPTELRLHRSESEIVRYAQGEGYVQVSGDGEVLLLVEEAEEPGSLDVAALREKIAAAEADLAAADEGSEAAAVATRDIGRYTKFIEIAGA
jgi:F-type H+-transporting ATPase subunit epsilon